MKKVYVSLSLAVAFGASAFAAGSSAQQALQFNKGVEVNSLTQVIPQSNMEKDLVVTTVDELVGPWFFEFNTGFDNDDHAGSVIFAKGSGANEVIIYGLVQRSGMTTGYGVKGTLNPSERTITIPEQVLDPDPEWGDAGGLKYIPFDISTGSRKAATTLTICKNGVSYSDGSSAYEDGCIATLGPEAGWIATEKHFADSSGVAIFYNVIISSVEVYGDESQQFFSYNAAEWADYGTASYTDGFMAPFFDDQGGSQTYNVDMKKKIGSEEYLLVNPYGAETPFVNVNADANLPGYIYINANDADCVLVRPGVYSGYNDQQIWPMGQLYFCNNEGNLYYAKEYSMDEVKEEIEYFGDTASNMKVEGTEVTINILNTQVAGVCDLFTYGIFPLGSNVVAPDPCTVKFSTAGVTGISDNTNAPKRFFNLQGVEIAQPAAGEIVIVKEGSKVTKTIVK